MDNFILDNVNLIGDFFVRLSEVCGNIDHRTVCLFLIVVFLVFLIGLFSK